MLTKQASIQQTMFAFLENYYSFLELISRENLKIGSGFNPKLIPRNSTCISRFLNELQEQHKPIKKNIPNQLVNQLLKFYATFIANGAPLEVPFVSLKDKSVVAAQLQNILNEPIISTDIFDAICMVVLRSLFCRCFPKYVQSIGLHHPIMKQLSQQYKNAVKEDQEHISTHAYTLNSKKTKESFFDRFTKKEQFSWKGTRENMIHVLQNTKLYEEFTVFVKVTFNINIEHSL
jgi:hypothetical protein